MKLTRSDLGDLYVFLNVVRYGGFRHAALELDVSASAISHALKSLEARLGVVLVNRAHPGVVMTSAGDDLYKRCLTGFISLETGVERLSRYRVGSEDRLRISLIGNAVATVLSPHLANFATSYPNVHLDISIQTASLDFFADGFDADIGFKSNSVEGLVALEIKPSLKWVMAASPAYLSQKEVPIGPDDLRKHRCIGVRGVDNEIAAWEVGSGVERHSVNLEYSTTVSDTGLAIDMATAGNGIIYCLRQQVDHLFDNGSLFEILPSWASDEERLFIRTADHPDKPNALKNFILALEAN